VTVKRRMGDSSRTQVWTESRHSPPKTLGLLSCDWMRDGKGVSPRKPLEFMAEENGSDLEEMNVAVQHMRKSLWTAMIAHRPLGSVRLEWSSNVSISRGPNCICHVLVSSKRRASAFSKIISRSDQT